MWTDSLSNLATSQFLWGAIFGILVALWIKR